MASDKLSKRDKFESALSSDFDDPIQVTCNGMLSVWETISRCRRFESKSIDNVDKNMAALDEVQDMLLQTTLSIPVVLGMNFSSR